MAIRQAPESLAAQPDRHEDGIGDELGRQNDKWAVQRCRYMTLESVAQLSDDRLVMLPAIAAWSVRPKPDDRRAHDREASLHGW